MVPEGWKEGRIGDLLEGLESGVSVNGEDRDFKKHEIAVLKVSSVSYGTFNPMAAKVINPKEIERAKINPKKGQIIISRSNTEVFVGASAYVDEDFPNLYLPDKLWQTIPKPQMNMKWLSYLLSSRYVRYTLSKLATGTSGSMKNITKGELLTLKVLIPPSGEQSRIAEILSTWDKAITTTEQLLANSQQQKKALMQQLLTGKKRLLDENGVRFSGEWDEVQLDEIFTFKKGKGLSKSSLDENGKWKCVLYGELYTKYSEVIDEVCSRTNSDDGTPSCFGDILIPSSTTTSGIDLANATAILEDGIRLGGDINILRPKKCLAPSFIAHLLTHVKKFEIASRAQGITIIHLYGSDLKSMTVSFPKSFEEQDKIARVLGSLRQEFSALESKLEALKQEKKALMQQLLTGKRRVRVDDEDAA